MVDVVVLAYAYHVHSTFGWEIRVSIRRLGTIFSYDNFVGSWGRLTGRMAADIQMQDIKEEALAKIQEITGIIPG